MDRDKWAEQQQELRREHQRRESLEEEATRLLKEAGGFGRGGTAISPRTEIRQRAGQIRFVEWRDTRVVEFYPEDLWRDLDQMAAALRMGPRQRQALGLLHLEELRLKDIARIMRTSVWQVRRLLEQAHLKLHARRHDPPAAYRQLFWQEVRQKKASVYRAPTRLYKPPRRCRARSAE
jgi:DNA-directed RNA polymerase specialized sigma24 family protein